MTRLTDREKDVLALRARGLSYAEIGKRLGMSYGTAAQHLTSIRRKIGIRAAHELQAELVRAGELAVHTIKAPAFTDRQNEIANLIVRGHTGLDIARALRLHHNTVYGHLDRIVRKLGLETRCELRAWLRDYVEEAA